MTVREANAAGSRQNIRYMPVHYERDIRSPTTHANVHPETRSENKLGSGEGLSPQKKPAPISSDFGPPDYAKVR